MNESNNGYVMLTTYDNPYNPFNQFEEWNNYDLARGYSTLSYIARAVISSDALSLSEQWQAYMDGLKSIVELNPGLYKIVRENTNI